MNLFLTSPHRGSVTWYMHSTKHRPHHYRTDFMTARFLSWRPYANNGCATAQEPVMSLTQGRTLLADNVDTQLLYCVVSSRLWHRQEAIVIDQ